MREARLGNLKTALDLTTREMFLMLSRAEVKKQVLERLVSEDGRPLSQPQVALRSLIELCECASEREKEGAGLVIVEILNELHLERLIVPGTANPNGIGDGPLSWPCFRVTEHGRKVAEATEYQPYDPDGYLARLRQELPDIDSRIVRYLEEALACLRADCLLAAAVMIGGAAEKAMLLLIEAFGYAIDDETQRKQYETETSSWLISRKYRALWGRLEPIAGTLPADLKDDLHTNLDRIFDLIRRTRNEAGHPTTGLMYRETVVANLILFPSYCLRVYGLMEYFANHPIT